MTESLPSKEFIQHLYRTKNSKGLKLLSSSIKKLWNCLQDPECTHLERVWVGSFLIWWTGDWEIAFDILKRFNKWMDFKNKVTIKQLRSLVKEPEVAGRWREEERIHIEEEGYNEYGFPEDDIPF